ncbi:MAG TPA: hypothetical protein VGG48_02205 [Rhizomicrobium sp.]|jgi:hypothetical protein
MKISDYFAEMYVAGRFAEEGWNVYFPRRDNGFDFIICKQDQQGGPVIRPVQVKGKYPEKDKTNKATYGFMGLLSQVHPDMVLAIPFFDSIDRDMPVFTAYVPRKLVRTSTRGYRCHPAIFENGRVEPRKHYTRFFGDAGIRMLEAPGWSNLQVEAD